MPSKVFTRAALTVDVQMGDVTEAIHVTWAGGDGGYIADIFGPGYDEEQLAFPTDNTECSFISLMALLFHACRDVLR